MPSPLVAGNSSIANRWLNGSANVMWLGDSIGVALEPYLLQMLRVTPAGWFMRGTQYSSISSSSWATLGTGGLGTVGLLAESNYSPFPAREVVFNGTTVPTTGFPAAVNSRVISQSGEAMLVGTRTGIVFGGVDWLAGQTAARLRCIVYRNSHSSAGIVRNYCRGSTGVYKGLGGYLNLTSSAPAYLADDIPLTATAVGEDLYLEAQSFEGATPAAGSNFVLCGSLVTSGAPGFTFIPASTSGWDITRWLDTGTITDGALAGVLPPLGITDFVIALGTNNTTSQTSAQFTASLLAVVARLRAAVPSASVTFLPMYDTNNPSTGNAPQLAGFCDAHYAAQKQTPNSCFLNLYSAAGPWANINAYGYTVDGIHPSAAGAGYVLQTLQGLIEQLLAGYSAGATGRYAGQPDIEDVFGSDNVAQWSSQDSTATIANVPRTQRSLDYADAAIDDYFRGGPYAVPLAPVSSAATVRRWASVLAGTWLFRSRLSTAGAAASASLALPAGASFTAAVNTSTDPYASLVNDVYAEMAACKAGVMRLDTPAAIATLVEAPSVV